MKGSCFLGATELRKQKNKKEENIQILVFSVTIPLNTKQTQHLNNRQIKDDGKQNVLKNKYIFTMSSGARQGYPGESFPPTSSHVSFSFSSSFIVMWFHLNQ